MGSIGILRNSANIFPAAKFPGQSVSTITGAYFNGQAVMAFDPDTIIMDTREIPAGVLGGTYNIGFFYDSTTSTIQGTPLMRIEIYEDDILMEEDTTIYSNGILYQYDLNFIEHIHDYGLFINKSLDANKSHRLVVKTSPQLSNDAILDYVMFEKVGNNEVMNGDPYTAHIGMRNLARTQDISTYGTQLITEQVRGQFKGNLLAGAGGSYGWSYNSKFKTVIGAYPTIIDGNGQLTLNWADWNPSTSQVEIDIRNNSSSTWNSASVSTSAWNYDNVRILVVGYI